MSSIPSTLNPNQPPIQYLRLRTGENILGTLVSENETEYVITNPVIATHFVNPTDGAVAYGSYPWAPHPSLMHLNYTIKKESVSVTAEVPAEYRGYTMVVERYKSYNQEDDSFFDEPEDEAEEDPEVETAEAEPESPWFDKPKRVLH